MKRFVTYGILAAIAFAAVAFAKTMPTTTCGPITREAAYRAALTQYANDDGSSGFMPIPYILAQDSKPLSPPSFTAPPVVQVTPAPPPQNTLLLGDYANAVLQWMQPILAPIIAGFIVDVLIKIRTMLGQSTTEAQRAKLFEMAQNGTNLAIHQAGANMAGKMPVQIRSAVMAQAVDYVQAHGSDTIKALGLDPTDPKAVQAIQGRVATILALKEQSAEVVPEAKTLVVKTSV